MSLNVPENTQAGTFIGTLSATDADGDEIARYELVGGNDFFDIEKDGGIWKVKLKAGVDHEVIAQQKHSLRIKATDDGGLSREQDITINVTDVNDNAPTEITLSNTTISESAKTNDIVGELSAIDADGDLIEYSLVENDFFELDEVNGKWVVKLKAGVDYEDVNQREHTLEVTATDGVHTSEIASITINVTGVNDNAPSGIVLNGGCL